MSKRIKVSKVNIRISDEQEIALTIEQARELRTALDEVLGKETVERIIERPYYPYTWQPYTWQPYTITYANTNQAEWTQIISSATTDNVCVPMGDWIPTTSAANERN